MASSHEISRMIAIEGIPQDHNRSETVEATEEEMLALIARFNLVELSGLKGQMKLRRVPGGKNIKIAGAFTADVVQSCVVSLQNVYARINGNFETYFTEEEEIRADVGFTVDDDLDAAEMLHDGMIDLGEVLSQYFGLELNPYPRAPGVSVPAQMSGSDNGETRKNPFAVLAGMKTDSEEGK